MAIDIFDNSSDHGTQIFDLDINNILIQDLKGNTLTKVNVHIGKKRIHINLKSGEIYINGKFVNSDGEIFTSNILKGE